jgi:predicted alpha-1,6-mannanase (GH76 family)
VSSEAVLTRGDRGWGAAFGIIACTVPLGACAGPAVSAETFANHSCPSGASEYCGYAQKVMSTFLASYARTGSQIAEGETVARESSDRAFGGTAMTWEDACTAEMIVDYYSATGDPAYLPIVKAYRSFNAIDDFGGGGFIHQSNRYNDDKLWWALAFIQAYERMPEHDAVYLRNAEAIFQNVCAQWNRAPGCGGGVVQAERGNYENTITNALLFQTAIKLYFDDPVDDTGVGTVTKNGPACAGAVPWTAYARPPAFPVAAGAPGGGGMGHQFQNNYLGWALAEYEWFMMPPALGQPVTTPSGLQTFPLPDGIAPPPSCAAGANGTNRYWTYNSGPILGALLDLSTVSPEQLPDPAEVVLGRAWTIADDAMTYFSKGRTQPLTEREDKSCAGNNNCPAFKGLFMRYLGRLAKASAPSEFSTRAAGFLEWNADAIWAGRLLTAVPTNCRTELLVAYRCDTAEGISLPLDWNAHRGSLAGWNYQAAMTSALDGLIAPIPMRPRHERRTRGRVGPKPSSPESAPSVQ